MKAPSPVEKQRRGFCGSNRKSGYAMGLSYRSDRARGSIDDWQVTYLFSVNIHSITLLIFLQIPNLKKTDYHPNVHNNPET